MHRGSILRRVKLRNPTRGRARAASTLVLLACVLAAPGPVRVAARQPTADLLIVNGRVFVADEKGSMAEAIAVAGNTILRVGTTSELSALRGPNTRVIDARGATVAPGFNDSHVHFISGGINLGYVDLAGLTALAQIQHAIKGFAAKTDAPWVQGRGWLYAPFPGGSPTKAQLDAIVADRPAVMTCYDGHSIWVNSKALALAGITKDTPNPPNGIVVKDPKTGEPTGHLKESASDLVRRVMPKLTAEDRRAALRKAVAHAHQAGVTSIQDAGVSLELLQIFEDAKKAGELGVRAYVALSVDADTTDKDIEQYEAARTRLGDDPTLRTGIVKIYADGVIESRTAAMLAPYVNDTSAGAPNMPPDTMARLVAGIDKRGWQIMIHAIGDRGIRMSLDALEHASKTNLASVRGRRHRLEHIETVDAADIPRFGKLGVIASQQPMHVALGDMNQDKPAGPWPDNIGPTRFARAWAWKSIHDAGGHIAFGSDWPVAPIEPGQGIWLAATRKGPAAAASQRLPMKDVLLGYTRWPAYASFDEHRKGSLAPGMLADIVILSTDVMSTLPASVNAVVVEKTIFDGKIVYERRAQ